MVLAVASSACATRAPARGPGVRSTITTGANSGATTTTGSASRTTAARGPGPTWIFTERALSQVSHDQVARAALGGARIFEIVPSGDVPNPGPGVIATVSFASYARMQVAFAAGRIPTWAGAVLYDDEAWPFTPRAEQLAPATSIARAAALVHGHHLVFIAAPSLSLAREQVQGAGTRESAYLQLHFAAIAARVADVVDVQAQSLENSTNGYAALVRQAAAQARAANPAVTVVAGLSTNPPAGPVSAAELVAAIHATRGFVSGYWFNIPSPGRYCPGCAPATPALATATLRALGAAGSGG